MERLYDYKLTQDEAEKYQAPMSIDLMAYFMIQRDAVLELLDMAQKEGWTENQFLDAVGNLFIDDKPTIISEE